MIEKQYFENLQKEFNELLNQNEGQKFLKLLNIDGKTQRGSGNDDQKPNHIVGAIDENGFSIKEELVDDKSNEITAVPKLLDSLNVKGHIVTLDAMGTQRDIAALIRKKRADYVLALKGNQGSLFRDVKAFFADPEVLAKCAYHKTTQKARGGVEVREYWQSDLVGWWLPQKKLWKGLRSVAMTRNTITKADGLVVVQDRFFISSLSLNVKEMARAIRGHWLVESVHWHLDVTFGEDGCRVFDRVVSYNLGVLW